MIDRTGFARARGVALVTGGTRGIGLGIARVLARDGWQLALCGVRSEDAVRDVLDELRAIGDGAEVAYEPADLAVPADRVRLVDAVRTRFGAIHALVNNAGRAPRVRADLLQATEESFEEVLRTNLQGPYFLTQQIAALMVAQRQAAPPPGHEPSDQEPSARPLAGAEPPAGAQQPAGPPQPATDAASNVASTSGAASTERAATAPAPGPGQAVAAPTGGIVFVTSVSADMASPNRGEYCVSKAGLAMTTKLFAVRLAEFGIPVYEVRPGIIATDMTAGVKEVYDRRIADGLIPDRRWGTPDDVGRAVAALLRGDVPYATGTVIHIDGGLALPRL